MKIRLKVGTKSMWNDLTTTVEFDATIRGRRTIGPSDDETLYKVSDGRMVVYTKTYNLSKNDTEYSLHLVTKKDLVVGGKFELLGRELGFCKPLTLDEALGIKKEPETEWSIWYTKFNRFLFYSNTFAEFEHKPDRRDKVSNGYFSHPVFFSREKAELSLAEWQKDISPIIPFADGCVIMPYWEKWYTVVHNGVHPDCYIIGDQALDTKCGFPADAYHGTVPLFRTEENADRWLDKVDERYNGTWRDSRHVIKEYIL